MLFTLPVPILHCKRPSCATAIEKIWPELRTIRSGQQLQCGRIHSSAVKSERFGAFPGATVPMHSESGGIESP